MGSDRNIDCDCETTTTTVNYNNLIEEGEYDSSNIINNSRFQGAEYTVISQVQFEKDNLIEILIEIRKIQGLENAILELIDTQEENMYYVTIPTADYEKLNDNTIKDDITNIKGILKYLKINKNLIFFIILFVIIIIYIIYLLIKK